MVACMCCSSLRSCRTESTNELPAALRSAVTVEEEGAKPQRLQSEPTRSEDHSAITRKRAAPTREGSVQAAFSDPNLEILLRLKRRRCLRPRSGGRPLPLVTCGALATGTATEPWPSVRRQVGL